MTSRPLPFVQGCSAKLLRSGPEHSVGKEHLLQGILFYFWWSITKCVWSSREKWKCQIRIDLVYGVKWIVLQNRKKYSERKTQKILCYKYLKFCQCASGGFVLRCRQCKEGEIWGRKLKLIESGQNLHWIPNWLWHPPASGLGNQTIKISQFLPISDYPKTYSKFRIYWNNYWEVIWNDPNKQRGHRRDN